MSNRVWDIFALWVYGYLAALFYDSFSSSPNISWFGFFACVALSLRYAARLMPPDSTCSLASVPPSADTTSRDF